MSKKKNALFDIFDLKKHGLTWAKISDKLEEQVDDCAEELRENS